MRKRAMRSCGVGALAGVLLCVSARAGAQGCITQAKMTPALRNDLATISQTLADAVKAADTVKVRGLTIAQFAANPESFAPTAALVRSTARKVAGDSLQVTQVYQLDARGRAANASGPAEFTCALSGTAAETDFSIPGLPPGQYGFSMVEASGPQPWLLAFLLQKDGEFWKLAGFYPRARTAAGHDGGYYWNAAYEAHKAKQPWLAWLLFDEAARLLQPAAFMTSTKLDSLLAQQRTAAPPELANGVSADAPLVLKAKDGTEIRLTGVSAEGSDDGSRLNIVLRYKANPVDDALVRNKLAARTFLDAHPELRQDFAAVVTIAEVAGQNPVVTEQKMAEIP